MASAKRNRQRRRRVDITEAAATLEQTRGDLVALDEASIRSDGTAAIKLISPGWGSSGYYSAEVLEAAGADRVWPSGTQMFWDHPTITERSDRPERSLRDLAAVFETDAVWQANGPTGPGLYAQAKVFEGFRPLLKEMADHIGVSIRAAAEVHAGEAEGRRGRIFSRIVEGSSVDFVTKAGRGGQVLAVLEAAHLREAGMWNDELREKLRTALRVRFPQDDGQYLWVRDFNDTELVFELEGTPGPGCFRLGYTVDGDDIVLDDGAPTKVEVHTTYEPVEEARNVAEWMQSRIHLDFTTRADDMFGDGRLTKDERIALSNGIGAALDAFSLTVEDLAPQLLDRDLWEKPTAAQATDSQEGLDMPITQEERAAIAAEAATAVVTQLTEAGVIPKPGSDTTDVDEAGRKLGEAEERARRAEEALLVEAARKHAAGNEKLKGLPVVTQTRLVEALALAAEATDDGKLDVTKLDEAIKAGVDAEVKYLAEATGSPVRGAGDDTPLGDLASTEEADARLAKSFERLGLPESTAKLAAAGR